VAGDLRVPACAAATAVGVGVIGRLRVSARTTRTGSANERLPARPAVAGVGRGASVGGGFSAVTAGTARSSCGAAAAAVAAGTSGRGGVDAAFSLTAGAAVAAIAEF